jgi:putative DNA primase/helicase
MKTKSQHETMLKFVYHRGNWYDYAGRVYIPITDEDMDAKIMAFLRERHPDHATKNMQANVIANLKAGNVAYIPSTVPMPVRVISPGEYVHVPGLMVMDNCIIDYDKATRALFMGEDIPTEQYVFPHTPTLITTVKLDYAFDPAADCPRFKKYLAEVLIEPDKIEQTQMMFGVAFVPATRYNVIFILYGNGGTGKTVLIHTLTHAVGKTNVCCVPLRVFSNRFALQPLTTCLLNIVGEMDTETDNSSSLGAVEGILKDISSGGDIRVEQKNKDAYMATATARNVFATNGLPNFIDRSDGIWDRLRIIPFELKIRDTDRDNKFLKEEIVANELPGIFMWAMEGYAKLLRLGRFPECARGKEIKNKYRLNCDHERMFLESRYEFTGMEADLIEVNQAYNEYRNWMTNNGYKGIRHIANFNDAMERIFKGVNKNRKNLPDGRKVSCWLGVKVKIL